MKHVLEMLQNARRLAEATQASEFLAELDAAEHRISSYDKLEDAVLENNQLRRTIEDLKALAAELRDELKQEKELSQAYRTSLKQRGPDPELPLLCRKTTSAEVEMQREKQIRPIPAGAAAEKTMVESVYDSIRQAGARKITKYVGQEWCRVGIPSSDNPCIALSTYTFLVLCEVRQDVETGELTRTPVLIKNLPWV